jgi:colanic acid biosynthesis glycosyl transferase WcaI
MHILLLTAYFPPDVGSASHLFYELGRAFVARGHQVSVVTGLPGYYVQGELDRYRHRPWLRETMAGMDVRRVAALQVTRNTRAGRGLWQFSCAATSALAGLRVPSADVCLVYSPPLPLGLSALVLRRAHGIPFVLNVQDLFPQSAIDLGLLRQSALIGVFEALERQIYQRADAITVHSTGNRAYVLARGGQAGSTRVVHNLVDTEQVCPGPKQNAVRRELGLNDHFLVSFAGVMGHSQDLDVVLEAANRLREHSDIYFLLVGDGTEKDRLVRKSQSLGLTNVAWLPMQPRERYPALLQSSDLGLATLRSEVRTPVVPSKILSIMASGRPVLAAMGQEGDAPVLIAEAEAGLCLPPERPQEMAEAILRLARDPALCRRLGANGRHYAEVHLSPAVVAGQYEELFAAAVEKSGK